jgi:ABC-type polar amino acid transport system ATPase subunit
LDQALKKRVTAVMLLVIITHALMTLESNKEGNFPVAGADVMKNSGVRKINHSVTLVLQNFA